MKNQDFCNIIFFIVCLGIVGGTGFLLFRYAPKYPETFPNRAFDERGTKAVPSYENPAYRIVLIDGCQYLCFSGNHERVITHKGNCTNQFHGVTLEH